MKDNVRFAYDYLTGRAIEKRSNGAIKSFSPEAASALIGNWIVETGDDDLLAIDVIEVGNKDGGRGLSQYSGVRRDPYDQARQIFADRGGDPNSIEFQLNYFVDEYIGKHDPSPGRSLIGWTKALENYSSSNDVEEAAKSLSDHYFRPSIPHLDRRIESAQRIFETYSSMPLGFELNKNRRHFYGTSNADSIDLSELKAFGKRYADRIFDFNQSEGDTLLFNLPEQSDSSSLDEWPYDFEFVAYKSKRRTALKLASKRGVDFVYATNGKQGFLYRDGNGSDVGWGKQSQGGLMAIFKGGDLSSFSPANFEIADA